MTAIVLQRNSERLKVEKHFKKAHLKLRHDTLTRSSRNQQVARLLGGDPELLCGPTWVLDTETRGGRDGWRGEGLANWDQAVSELMGNWA